MLGCEIEYSPYPYSKKTRWNNRLPGNGRYPGYGLVRRFSGNSIHLFLRVPQITGAFEDAGSVLDAIKKAKTVVDTQTHIV